MPGGVSLNTPRLTLSADQYPSGAPPFPRFLREGGDFDFHTPHIHRNLRIGSLRSHAREGTASALSNHSSQRNIYEIACILATGIPENPA